MSCSTYAPPTEVAEEHNSPPFKKRRTLDISDVSCLVATRQKAAFPSPEKSIHSKSSDPQSSRKLQEIDVLSQELIEEDTMVQSSLPQYFNHIYGGYIGCSKLTDYQEMPTFLYPANDGSVSCDSPVIEESQGFTVRGLSEGAVNFTGAESESTVPNNTSPANSPLLFQSPISPPKSPSSVDNTRVESNSETAPLPCPSQVKTYHIEKPMAPPMSVTSAAVSLTSNVSISNKKEKSTRKRKLSSSTVPRRKSKFKYVCPPSCVTLMDCTSMKSESTVSILAIILQGTRMCMYMYMHVFLTLSWLGDKLTKSIQTHNTIRSCYQLSHLTSGPNKVYTCTCTCK